MYGRLRAVFIGGTQGVRPRAFTLLEKAAPQGRMRGLLPAALFPAPSRAGNARPYGIGLLVHNRALDLVGGFGTSQDAGQRKSKGNRRAQRLAGDNVAVNRQR